MSVRQWMNQNPTLAGIIAVGLVVVAIIIIVYQQTHSGSAAAPPLPPQTADFTKAFYSDDDGKTFFSDNLGKVTPFSHGGKTAVRAYVFKCGSNTMVGYLGQVSDAGRALPGAASLGTDERKMRTLAANPAVFEVKKPCDAKWVPLSPSGQAQWLPIVDVKCPSGDTPIAIFVGQQ